MRLLLLGLALVWLSGCATYASRIQRPRSLFRAGEYGPAIEELKKLVDNHDKDELLYLMDLGLVQHTAGIYADAIATFTRADKMAEVKDYTSVSQEAASLLTSDDAKVYKGEDFEKLLIDVYLAMDYTLQHSWEDALVEARVVNHKIDLYNSEGKLPYEHNAFAKYLSASLFEARKEYDDAFVDYRLLAKWVPGYPYLGVPLLRLAATLQDSQEFDEYKKQFPSDAGRYRLAPGDGEIILLLEQGRAPIKVPNPSFKLMPIFRRQSYYSAYARLRVDGAPGEARSYTLFDIEQTAIKELDHKSGPILAKKLAGMAVKGAVGYGVAKATGSKELGELAGLLLFASDHADLRSWSTLPAKLQLARLAVPAGRHNVMLDMVSAYGTESRAAKEWVGVNVKPGETVFLNYRSRD